MPVAGAHQGMPPPLWGPLCPAGSLTLGTRCPTLQPAHLGLCPHILPCLHLTWAALAGLGLGRGLAWPPWPCRWGSASASALMPGEAAAEGKPGSQCWLGSKLPRGGLCLPLLPQDTQPWKARSQSSGILPALGDGVRRAGTGGTVALLCCPCWSKCLGPWEGGSSTTPAGTQSPTP